MFDCIIVGSGPAGSTAAYHLAKKGKSVLVLEKQSKERQKPCGGGVSPAIAKYFAEVDFAPVIDNTITQVQYTWKMGDPVKADLNLTEPMWMVKRDLFDSFLRQQAQAQGAEIKENTEVTGVKWDGKSWQVSTSQGNFSSSYIIAADGVNGPMAKWLGFEEGDRFLAASLEVEANVPKDKQNLAYFDFGAIKNGFIWNFPKSNGYSLSIAVFKGGKVKSEELKKQITNYAKEFGLNLANSQYYEHAIRVWSQHQPLHTNNAVLVGEAAGIVDPLTGEGIRPAMDTGRLAALAITAAIEGKTDALAEYSKTVGDTWASELVWAQRLAGLFHQFPQIAYKIGVKRPAAAQIMGKVLCGELRYSDVTEQAMSKIKKSLIPGMGR